MATEVFVADQSIYSLLSGDAVLQGLAGGVASLATRIGVSPLPPETAEPFISFDTLTLGDVITVGAHRVYTDAEYLIKAIAETNTYSALDSWADAIDSALDKQSHTVAGSGIVYHIYRDRPFRFNEVVQRTTSTGTRVFRHLGGVYQVIVQAPIGGQP